MLGRSFVHSTMDDFQTYRPLLFSIAYRMTGSASQAEDIVQDAYLRYQQAETATIHSLKKLFLTLTRKVPANHRLFIEDINGAPALLSWSESQLNWVLTLDIFDNSIEGLRSILNPDKLAFLQRQLERRQKQKQLDLLE